MFERFKKDPLDDKNAMWVIPTAEGQHGGLLPGHTPEELEASITRLLAEEPIESEKEEAADIRTES